VPSIVPSTIGNRAQQWLPAVAVFVVVLLAWEGVVRAFNIQRFLLPAPSVIWATFWAILPEIVQAAQYTAVNALGGLVLGAALGVLVALSTARWTVINEGLMPFAVAVNAMPIIAVAPILNQWFGLQNPLAKISVVALLVFFPVMINMVRGLTQVNASALELMRSYAASEFTILRQLRIPNALPFLFGALRVGASLSVIAAVVSEYFGGTQRALGQFIAQRAGLFNFAEAWAGIVLACALGLTLFGLVVLLERVGVPWRRASHES
jgi:NitT/TauT family transport system permease protein